ncbi:putative RNA-directed DNA polymerase [Tanacetum coccineum]
MESTTVVLYPSPGIGHLVSMVELGRLIQTHHPSLSVIILVITATFETVATDKYIATVSATNPPSHHSSTRLLYRIHRPCFRYPRTLQPNCPRHPLEAEAFQLSLTLVVVGALVVRLTEGASAVTLRARLDQLDLLAESGPLSPNNIEIRFNIVKDLMCLENQLIKDLKQKAKCKWAKDGDENSGFFHGIINSRLNRSRLNGLNILGSWVTEPSLITEHIFHVFEKKFKETNLSRPTFSSNLFNHLSLEDITFLDRPFSNQEIKDAVLGCGGDKAPGPDCIIPRGCNSSFITLVPKVDDPTVIGDFRPISLIGCQYKILAKVLANLDFEKAFDTLSWSFLDSIMSQMGFSSKWRNWIKSCLNSAYASILINGSPSKEFKVERAKNKNKFHGIEVGKDKTYISHLQFADDALIMGEWSLTNAKNLSRILTCFHLAFGLKVNFNKSKLFGVGVTPLEVNSIALSIGCQPSQFPCIYLGLPIGENMSRCANWSPLIDRFLKRLSRWKSKTLSFGGRLTLIKSVLGGLGVYYFSTFKAPKKIIDKLESIRRNFFWGGSLLNDDLLPIVIDLRNIFKRKVGNGESTRFWIDNWLGGGPLNVSYPRLFRLEVNKNGLVRDRAPTVPQHHTVSFSGAATTGPHTLSSMGPILPPGLHFQWTWSRPLRSQHEIDELNEIVSLLSNLHLSNSHDTWECYLNHSHGFSVNLIRKHIIHQSHNLLSQLFKWNNLVPIKIWKDVLLWWKVDNINVLSLLEAINLVDKVSLPPPLFALFDAVVQATLWFLWRYRNEFAFSPKKPPLQ